MPQRGQPVLAARASLLDVANGEEFADALLDLLGDLRDGESAAVVEQGDDSLGEDIDPHAGTGVECAHWIDPPLGYSNRNLT